VLVCCSQIQALLEPVAWHEHPVGTVAKGTVTTGRGTVVVEVLVGGTDVVVTGGTVTGGTVTGAPVVVVSGGGKGGTFTTRTIWMSRQTMTCGTDTQHTLKGWGRGWRDGP
jgi:hypothetical protein